MQLRLFARIFVILCVLIIPTMSILQPQTVDPLVPKNIVFGAISGGSSHMKWVLSILDELADRGHNVTFAAGDGHARYGANHENITTVSISDPDEAILDDAANKWAHLDWVDIIATAMRFQTPIYVGEFTAFKSVFQEINADIVLCDFSSAACIDAATVLKLPLIGTMFVGSTPDAQAPYIERTWFTMQEPTTLTTSFVTRFYNRYILMLRAIIFLWSPIQQHKVARRQVNALPFTPDPLENSLKIVNSAFGFEPARPLGPLVEMVGPIVDRNYAPLTPQLAEYLDRHSRVALVAFGQSFSPTQDDVLLLLGALVDNVEKGSIDGFVWAKAVLDPQRFPESLISASGKPYNISNLVSGQDPHMRIERWVPQQALLQHPAVSVFLSHGGVGSIYESLVNGIPLVIFPLLGDQLVNARMVEDNGMGRFMDHRVSPKDASAILEVVARDATGAFKRNVERYGALVRIRSAHGASRGADLVEEVLVMHQDGMLPHRYEASRRMSYLKATNLDLDVAMLLSVVIVACASWKAAHIVTKGLATPAKITAH